MGEFRVFAVRNVLTPSSLILPHPSLRSPVPDASGYVRDTTLTTRYDIFSLLAYVRRVMKWPFVSWPMLPIRAKKNGCWGCSRPQSALPASVGCALLSTPLHLVLHLLKEIRSPEWHKDPVGSQRPWPVNSTTTGTGPVLPPTNHLFPHRAQAWHGLSVRSKCGD